MQSKSIIIILLIFIVAISLCSLPSFASDITKDAGSFIDAGTGDPSGTNREALTGAIDEIAGMLMGIGVILAVIVAAILGIKFMVSSVDEQAKIKEMIIPYVCGCVVIFGAYGIWQLVVGILNSTIL